MSEDTKVRTLAEDEKTLLRVQQISANGKTVITPTKGIDLVKLTSSTKKHFPTRQINEIYREITPEKIKEVNSSSIELDEFAQKISTELNKSEKDKELSLLFVKFAGLRYPTEKEIEFLTDVSYEYSDITPIPSVTEYPKELNETKLEGFMGYLKDSIETIKQLNKTPIMGVLPLGLPRDYFSEKLIPFYLENGINSFYFDFEGKMLNPLGLRPILRYLSHEKVLEKCFLYSINANIGRLKKEANAITAKDFLNFGYGFSAVGEQHVRVKRPKEFYANLKLIKSDKVRMFNSTDYGYYRVESKTEIEKLCPSNGSFSVEDIFTDKKKMAKVFNMQQQLFETSVLQQKVSEDNAKGALNYLDSKQYAKDDLKLMIKTRKEVNKR